MSKCNGSTSALELDIGGTLFKTTAATLARHPDTFFAALAQNAIDATAPLFIDRDPTHFRHLLNYLRSGVVTAPVDERGQRELLAEAEFYGLRNFARVLRAPELDLTRHLDAATLAERDEEARIRGRHAAGARADGRRPGKYEGLVDVFQTHAGGLTFAAPPPTDSQSTLLFDTLEEKAPLGREGAPATCKYTHRFLANFKRAFPDVLERLEPLMQNGAPFFIAGGSCLLALTALLPDIIAPQRRDSCYRLKTFHTANWGDAGDVDIFVHASTPDECTACARQIWEALAVDGEHWRLERSRGVLNILRSPRGWPDDVDVVVQVVLRQYADPSEILTCFDVDCCGVGFCYFGFCYHDQTDLCGWHVLALPRCIRALQSGRNVVNALHGWPRSPAYEIRLAKYATRGFSVHCPGIDPAQVDHGRVRGASFEALDGVARLLRLANLLEATRPSSFREAKALMAKVGINVKYSLSAIYDAPVRTLPGEEPVNKGNEFSKLGDDLTEAPPSTVDQLRRMHPRDLAWWLLSSVKNYLDDDRETKIATASTKMRSAVWENIADAGHDNLDIPRRITWDNTHNQREYRNARDKDQAAIYYAHAYK